MVLSSYLADLTALASVVIIDVALAGDNAVVVGMVAARLPAEQRRKVILWGIGVATAFRILLAVIAVQLLAIVGLTLAGGILLLFVSWSLYRELRPHGGSIRQSLQTPRPKPFRTALFQVVAADVSMSFDNVLAIAGTARNHLVVLVVGLLLSVALMGLASQAIARHLEHHRWIAWGGLAIVAVVAGRMIYDGSAEVIIHTQSRL